jgi:hypothetical protein
MKGKRDIVQCQTCLRCNDARRLPFKGPDITHVSVNTQLRLFCALNYEIMQLEFCLPFSMEASLNRRPATFAWQTGKVEHLIGVYTDNAHPIWH